MTCDNPWIICCDNFLKCSTRAKSIKIVKQKSTKQSSVMDCAISATKSKNDETVPKSARHKQYLFTRWWINVCGWCVRTLPWTVRELIGGAHITIPPVILRQKNVFETRGRRINHHVDAAEYGGSNFSRFCSVLS